MIRYARSLIGWVAMALIAIAYGVGPSANAADIAIIDYADQWTNVRGLVEGFDALGIPYDDITDDAKGGAIALSGQRVLFLSSMYTNNPSLKKAMDDNADQIASFVKNGGVVIEPTQADQNEAVVAWLPSGLAITRSDPDQPQFTIVAKNHPMFTSPNKLTDDNFVGWGYQNWPTVWEVIAVQKGFDVLAESAGKMAVGEARFGQGMFVALCVAPDKYAAVGKDDNTKKQATLFLENLANAYLPTAVSPAGRLATTWGRLRRP